MDKLTIVLNKRALSHFERIVEWYSFNMGKMAAMKFAKGIHSALQTLSHSPQIGIIDETRSTNDIIYYSFLSHPKYRIIYRYTHDKLVVVAIHSTLMNTRSN